MMEAMRRLAVLTIALVAALGGSALAAQPFARGEALVSTGTRTVVLDVEIAETPEQHSLGLMHRRRLARNAGMAFVFDGPTSGGFWMKNTLIPLSIAFYDRRGRILRILTMEPCRADPCRVYSPGVVYRGALEVNRGTFGRLGIGRGDVIRIRRTRG
jgi:uncharacterized membrane protein (UPF0127 family)